jgi:hypothetical protein
MATSESIFRDYKPAEAERSDRSAGDRLRHRQKVRESIRENIADIIAEESIIGKNKDRVIKVPLRGIKEYRFVFGENAPGAGTGDGNAQPGQVVGKAGQEQGQGDGQGGDKPGVDYYETDVTLEELIDIMFEDLELPNLERKALREVLSDKSSKRKGYRQVGIRVRLDKRRSAKQRVMRMLATQRGGQGVAPEDLSADLPDDASEELDDAIDETAANFDGGGAVGGLTNTRVRKRFPFHQRDLRYKHIEVDTREESNAVVMCIMDTSGSMDTMK